MFTLLLVFLCDYELSLFLNTIGFYFSRSSSGDASDHDPCSSTPCWCCYPKVIIIPLIRKPGVVYQHVSPPYPQPASSRAPEVLMNACFRSTAPHPHTSSPPSVRPLMVGGKEPPFPLHLLLLLLLLRRLRFESP